MLVAIIAPEISIVPVDLVHVRLIENHAKKIFVNVICFVERVFYQFDLCPTPFDDKQVSVHEIRRCTDVDDRRKR